MGKREKRRVIFMVIGQMLPLFQGHLSDRVLLVDPGDQTVQYPMDLNFLLVPVSL